MAEKNIYTVVVADDEDRTDSGLAVQIGNSRSLQ